MKNASCVVFITKSEESDRVGKTEFDRYPGVQGRTSALVPYKMSRGPGHPPFVVVDGKAENSPLKGVLQGGVGVESVELLCPLLSRILREILQKEKGERIADVLVCAHWGGRNDNEELDRRLNEALKNSRRYGSWTFCSLSSQRTQIIDVSKERCPIILPEANFAEWADAIDHGLHELTSWNRVCDFVEGLRQRKEIGDAAVESGLLSTDDQRKYWAAYKDDSCIAWILQKAGVDKIFAELIKDGSVSSFPDCDKMLKDLDAAMEFPSPQADGSAAQKVGQQLSETQSAGTKFAESNKAEEDKADTPVTRIGKGRLLAGMVWVNSILLLLLILPFVLVCVREHVVCPPVSKQSSPYGSSVSWSEASAAHCLSTNDCATCAGNNQKNSKPHVADPVRSAGVGLCRILALAFAGFLYIGACSIMTAWGRGAYKAYVRRCREDEARWIADRLSHENGTEMEQVHRKMLCCRKCPRYPLTRCRTSGL